MLSSRSTLSPYLNFGVQVSISRKRTADYNEYQKAKYAVQRLIKAQEQVFKKQVEAKYDVIAPVNDIQVQLEGNTEPIN